MEYVLYCSFYCSKKSEHFLHRCLPRTPNSFYLDIIIWHLTFGALSISNLILSNQKFQRCWKAYPCPIASHLSMGCPKVFLKTCYYLSLSVVVLLTLAAFRHLRTAIMHYSLRLWVMQGVNCQKLSKQKCVLLALKIARMGKSQGKETIWLNVMSSCLLK